MENVERYQNIAQSYESYYGINSPTMEEMRLTEFSQIDEIFTEKGPFANILDAGCGSGLHTFYLAKGDRAVVGIDNVNEMIEVARSRIAANSSNKKIVFVRAEIDKLPFQDEEFDLVVCLFGGFYHTSNYHQIISEFHRVMKPNGICLISVLNRWRIQRILHSVLNFRFKWLFDALQNRPSTLMDRNCIEIPDSYTIYFSSASVRKLFRAQGFGFRNAVGRFTLIRPIYEAQMEGPNRSVFWKALRKLDRQISKSKFALLFCDILFLSFKKITN
jgi:ubiquinone/menaquinone biosynthesis C-methylase UbiE